MRRRFLFALIGAAAVSIVVIPALANPWWVGYFEVIDRPYSLEIPENGAYWQSLSSTFSNDNYPGVLRQEAYYDNGDGVISPGDRMGGWTTGGDWSNVLIDSTSHLYRFENGWVLHSLNEDGGSPIGEVWEILQPPDLWGTRYEVTGWNPVDPEGSEEPVAGDEISLGRPHYTLASVNLCARGAWAVPVERSSWGKLKQILGKLL
jgi:hypothetical protein